MVHSLMIASTTHEVTDKHIIHAPVEYIMLCAKGHSVCVQRGLVQEGPVERLTCQR